MQDYIFWNKAAIHDSGRSVDPLGFVALRETMADTLVPLLTGATQSADDYIWVLIGLRWAIERTGTSIEDKVYNDPKYGFAIFERALKQYWYRKSGKKSSGINVIKDLCEGAKPDVTRSILADQRGVGLLGNYIVSLRGMGLIENNTVSLKLEEVDRLLGDILFNERRDWLSSWNTLIDAFDKTYNPALFKAARYRLGVKMFSENQDMKRAARSVLLARHAQSWNEVNRKVLDEEQTRIAGITKHVAQLESRALTVFSGMLHGRDRLSTSEKASLRSAAMSVSNNGPFPVSWTTDNPLRKAMSTGIASLARGSNPLEAILDLHISVTQKARQNDPWINRVGELNPYVSKWSPNKELPDYRFGNLLRLIEQTGCKKHVI